MGPDEATTWTLSGVDNAGSIDPASALASSFQSIQNLTGRTDADTFIFATDGIGVTGTINGGSSSGNSLVYSGYTSAVSIDLQNSTATNVDNGFSNIQTFTGKDGQNNTITGANAISTWNITGSNLGDIGSTVYFNYFPNLIGGSAADTFNLELGGSVVNISGNLGANIYNIKGGDVSGTITSGTTSDQIIFEDTRTITGSVDVSLGGRLIYSDYTTAVSVNLGNGVATGIGSNITSSLTLTYTKGSDTANGTLIGNSTWIITGVNEGTVDGIGFDHYDILEGGSGDDTFTLQINGQITGHIDGIAGTNTLTGPDEVTTWTISGVDNSGSIDPASASATAFQNIPNLTGGTGADTFIFATDSVGVTGAINGGSGSGNSLVYSGYTSPIAIDLQNSTATQVDGGFSNIQTFTGPASYSSTITGANTNNTWNITNDNIGNIGGSVFFNNFANLVGGTGNDDFVLSNDKGVSGTINGTGTSGNSLSYAAYIVTDATIDLSNGTATNTGSISNLQTFVGGQGTNDKIVSPDTSNTWEITATDAATITPTTGSILYFSEIENWTGGEGDSDTFVMHDGMEVTGKVDGGGGSHNELDYSNFTGPIIINLEDEYASNIYNLQPGGVLNIQDGSGTGILIGGPGDDIFTVGTGPSIVDGGGGDNTLIGPNQDNTWVITSSNSGTLNGEVTFTLMQNLTGRSHNDSFVFNTGGSLDGLINGATSSGNSINYSNLLTAISVNLATSATSYTGGFLNIQSFTGAPNQDNTLAGYNSSTTWHITGDDAGTVGTVSFSDFPYLTGGSSNDVFIFDGAYQITGSINSGGGSNTLHGPNVANIWKITGSNSGTLLPTGAGGETIFNNTQNVTGGSSPDRFMFYSGGSVSGIVDGNSNSGNTLDYTFFGSASYVNLINRTATATGGWRNIQNFLNVTYLLTSEYAQYLFYQLSLVNAETARNLGFFNPYGYFVNYAKELKDENIFPSYDFLIDRNHVIRQKNLQKLHIKKDIDLYRT